MATFKIGNQVYNFADIFEEKIGHNSKIVIADQIYHFAVIFVKNFGHFRPHNLRIFLLFNCRKDDEIFLIFLPQFKILIVD